MTLPGVDINIDLAVYKLQYHGKLDEGRRTAEHATTELLDLVKTTYRPPLPGSKGRYCS